jgi:hypothetical protein
MSIDPVAAVESLGYTEREASFLYLAGIHSGYFLRRQFDSFIARKTGGAAQKFIDKARRLRHVNIIDYGRGNYVYHLMAKSLYRRFGSAESQNRRIKGDSEIRLHLMALDYVLEHSDDHFLETLEQKLGFFLDVRGVPPSLIRTRQRTQRPFVLSLPISIVDRTQPATSVVRFPFMDEALLSTRKFTRFLRELGPLMLALGNFEVVYTALSSANFLAAEAAFRNAFEMAVTRRQPALPGFSSPFEPYSACLRPLHARFTTLLFHFNYPHLLRYEARGEVPRSISGSNMGRKIA